MMLSELVFSPHPVDPGFQLPPSCVQAHTWPQCSVVQHRPLCMRIISLLLPPNQQELPAPKPPSTHPNPSTSHRHRCPVDALSPISIAAKQKQESRFYSEMYRAMKLGLEEKHKQECAESTFLHLPSLKMWAVIHSTKVYGVGTHTWNGRGGMGGASPVDQLVETPSANLGGTRDMDSIPGSGRSPQVGNGNPLQYSCLENAMDREAWWATAQGISKSQTWLSTHTCIHTYRTGNQSSLP